MPTTNNSSDPNGSTQAVFNWMQAYQAAAQAGTPHSVKPVVKKENPVVDEMQGGWRKEGKEKPETPKTCTKCQWDQRNSQQKAPDKKGWCGACLNNEVLGHEPAGGRPLFTAKASEDLSQNFFGNV